MAVSYDPVNVLRDFADRRKITFPLLSDEGSSVITRYGILNTTLEPTNEVYGIPFPGTFMLDANGRVTSRFFESAYAERDTISSVMARLGGPADTPGTTISAPHLRVAAYATDQIVAPGTHFSLVLDVTPDPHVHVYAPGVAQYKAIALRVTPKPALLLKGTQFTKPEDYFFEPLNEHVPVYQKPFRIVQDVMFD